MDWLLLLRCLHIAGSLLCLYLLSTVHFRQWKTWNDRTRHHWWAMTGWVFLCVESTIEHILLDTQPGPRLLLTTAIIALTLRALSIDQPLRADPVVKRKEHS